jgi:hypothetical protein
VGVGDVGGVMRWVGRGCDIDKGACDMWCYWWYM